MFLSCYFKLSHTHRFQRECCRGDGAATDDPWQGWCEEVGCTSFGSPHQNGVSHHWGGTRTSTAVLHIIIVYNYSIMTACAHGPYTLLYMYVNDIVTDWRMARRRLLVSQFSHWKCFFRKIHMCSIWVVTNLCFHCIGPWGPSCAMSRPRPLCA